MAQQARIFISPKFFTYKGPATKPGNSLYLCLNCPPKTPEKLLSCSDISKINLKKHMDAKHPGQSNDFEDACSGEKSAAKRKRVDYEVVGESASSSHQPTIKESMKKNSKPSFSKEDFDQWIMEYIVDSVLSIRHVETDPFIKLMERLAPGMKVMCRQTLTSRIESSFKEGKDVAINKLGTIDDICTTSDCWTSRGRSFIGTTGHWMEPKPGVGIVRQSICLGIKRVTGRHTFDVIGKKIESIHQDFGIEDKVRITVTDSGSNFLKAFRVFGPDQEIDSGSAEKVPEIDEESGYEESGSFLEEFVEISSILDAGNKVYEHGEMCRLPMHRKCACHLLNLIATSDAKEAQEDANFKRNYRSVFAKLQALFNKQGRSGQAAEKIKEALGVLLVIPNATRWNSWFDAIRHVVKLIDCDPRAMANKNERDKVAKQKLNSLCESLSVTKFNPTDYTFMAEYVKVMVPIAHALDVLQGEQNTNITAGHLLPAIVVVKATLKKMKEDKEVLLTLPLITALIEGVSRRFDPFFLREELQLAATLHPKFKLSWMDEDFYETLCDPKKKERAITRQSITTKLEEKMAELFDSLEESRILSTSEGGAMVSPDDPKDFFSSLTKRQSSSSDVQKKFS